MRSYWVVKIWRVEERAHRLDGNVEIAVVVFGMCCCNGEVEVVRKTFSGTRSI